MKHTCHWVGCNKEVPPSMWGCKSHWFRLPRFIRDRIWATYRTGQEITKTPSKSYLVAASAARKWIELAGEFGDKMATEQFQKFINEKGWPDEPKSLDGGEGGLL